MSVMNLQCHSVPHCLYTVFVICPHSDTEFTGNTALQHDFTFGGSAGHGKCLEAKLSSGKLFSSCASGQTAVYRLTVSAYTMIRQVTDKTDGVGRSEHKPDTTLLKGIRLTEYKKIYILTINKRLKELKRTNHFNIFSAPNILFMEVKREFPQSCSCTQTQYQSTAVLVSQSLILGHVHSHIPGTTMHRHGGYCNKTRGNLLVFWESRLDTCSSWVQNWRAEKCKACLMDQGRHFFFHTQSMLLFILVFYLISTCTPNDIINENTTFTAKVLAAQ